MPQVPADPVGAGVGPTLYPRGGLKAVETKEDQTARLIAWWFLAALAVLAFAVFILRDVVLLFLWRQNYI